MAGNLVRAFQVIDQQERGLKEPRSLAQLAHEVGSSLEVGLRWLRKLDFSQRIDCIRSLKSAFALLAKEMTFNELKNRLGSIRMVFDGKGRGHWMEVTTRQHEIARRLGCPGLYKSVPAWVPVR